MPIPAYLWLKDDGGADIRGTVDLQDREVSIEILGFSHGVNLPVDTATGKITGKRSHAPISFEKEFDSSSPTFIKLYQRGRHSNQLNSNGIELIMLVRKKNISICYWKA